MCYTDNINNSVVIFGYNGRDGVVTDTNGLIYMRARYYCPEMRRFVNADIIAGKISNAITLNRYAYANGNPVSNIDPFGLEPLLDDYINTHYSGLMTVTLIIDAPVPNSRNAATIENGKLENGHSFIRLDDGKGNVKYVGFAAEKIDLKRMIFGIGVDGKQQDDSTHSWDVAKVYTVTQTKYEIINAYINFQRLTDPKYDIETYNCTTFAIDVSKLTGATGNFLPVYEHDWQLPDDTAQQLSEYSALPEFFEGKERLISLGLEITMGNFHGYTPADAAEDLKHAEGEVLLMKDNSINAITNKFYFRNK